MTNLEWATSTEQNKHKRIPKKEIQELVSSRPVWRIDKDTNEKLELYQTIKFASQWVFDNKLTSITDFNNGNNIKTKICAVCQKKYQRNTAFGYKWEYCNKNETKYDDEEWKDIPSDIIKGTKGYKISNYGRVKNHKGRITEGANHESGYLWACILYFSPFSFSFSFSSIKHHRYSLVVERNTLGKRCVKLEKRSFNLFILNSSFLSFFIFIFIFIHKTS